MSDPGFVHLRVHSAYSLSEGAIQVNELVALCCNQGMPAVAITDTNNLFGAFEFSAAAAQAGVQPIIGCQLAVALETPKNPRHLNGSRSPDTSNVVSAPMVFLIQNQTGYNNLLKLLSLAYIGTDVSSDPMVPMAAIASHAEGIIAFTGGPDGPVGPLCRFPADGAASRLDRRAARAALAGARCAPGDSPCRRRCDFGCDHPCETRAALPPRATPTRRH